MTQTADHKHIPATARPFRNRFTIWAWQAKGLLGQLFYKLGEAAEYDIVRFARVLKAIGFLFAALLGRPLARLGHGILLGLRTVAEDLTAPFRRLHRGAANIRALVADEKQNGLGHALRQGLRYFGRGVRHNAYLGRNLLYYLLPLAAGGVFVFTVTTTLQRNFALAVKYDGRLVGYVTQEATYEEAARMVQDQIVYTGDEQKWALTPSFTIATASSGEVSDTQTLANAILENSGAEITQAVGLYVDDVFYGATTQGDQLAAAIEAIKAPYEAENPDGQVEFVQKVEQRSGIYLAQSVVDYAQLEKLLSQEVEGQRTYTIASGDTPWKIAGENGITLDELYALNPVLDNGNNMPVGEPLVIGQSVSFLQVKVVKTQVEQQAIAYNTVKTNDSSLAFGKTKVTQEGVDGVQQVTYQYTYVDGKMTEKTAVGDVVVLSEPVEEHISVGTYVSSSGVSFVPSGGGSMIFPIGPGFHYMSRGFTGVSAHNGLDLCGAYGTPIYAAQSGVVTYASATSGGYGRHVIIDHGGGVQTLYGHCSSLAVSAGQAVSQGQVIAYMGSTGNSTGNHCHFEVIINGTRVNPAPYIGMG